ncbi:MAG: hypothetical protein KC503_30465 [Myxococcales bacterium]|nr:hypothetical protein [Myxococcales bacterium]
MRLALVLSSLLVCGAASPASAQSLYPEGTFDDSGRRRERPLVLRTFASEEAQHAFLWAHVPRYRAALNLRRTGLLLTVLGALAIHAGAIGFLVAELTCLDQALGNLFGEPRPCEVPTATLVSVIVVGVATLAGGIVVQGVGHSRVWRERRAYPVVTPKRAALRVSVDLAPRRGGLSAQLALRF